MPSRDQLPRPPAASLRVLAGLLALFVLALACAVQSPSAHAWLHGLSHDDHAAHPAHTGHDRAADEAGCPVTLFAQGLTAPLAAPPLDAPRLLAAAALPATPATCAPVAPRRLHPPAQAPPAAA